MRPPGLIILAAGGSTRMGQPKQLLPWKGRTLLRHACETALATVCRPVLVVLGCEAEACMRELSGLKVLPVINPDWAKGMGGSISAGIKALETNAPDSSGVLLMLVDQPSVTSYLLDSLAMLWQPPGGPIVATKYPQGGGVPAVFSRDFFPELRALDSDRGARGLIEREKSRVDLIDPQEDLIDLDTPEIFQASSGR